MSASLRGAVKNYLAVFFPLRAPYPLSGKSFCRKNISENGGYLNGKNLLRSFGRRP